LQFDTAGRNVTVEKRARAMLIGEQQTQFEIAGHDDNS
jgi:hypothetical protein